MTRQIVIDPVSRIEGHAKITLVLKDDGSVAEARFHVTEFRGFEKFCEGRSFREMPAITSRICGICPVSHLIASAKTGDLLLGVEPPAAAVQLRRIMNMGQIIQSHSLSFFHLSSPDLILGFGSDPAQRNLVGLIQVRPDLARRGIALRRYGQRIIESLGGKRIHTAWSIPGGVASPLPEATRLQLLADLPAALNDIRLTLQEFKRLLDSFHEEIIHFGNFPSLFLGLVTQEGNWEHYAGKLRIGSATGQILADNLDPFDYDHFLGEAVEDWSYLKFPYYKPQGYPGGIYRVGPLARINLAEQFGTSEADRELNEFRQRFGRTPTSSFLYHYARLLEILASLERIALVLDDPGITSQRVQSQAELNREEAVGISEAPRGTLFHHYRVDANGLLVRINLLIATGQNNLAMNRAIKQIADRYLTGNQLNDEMLNRVEAGIRAFDPCLSCSTHAFGSMPLSIELRDSQNKLVDQRLRG